MAGMHALLMALVAAYIGPKMATRIDRRCQSKGAIRDIEWRTADRLPPRRLSIEEGVTTIIITCDNQDVVRAARTESLTVAPHKGGTARAPGYATHNEVVEAKRALTRAGASVQIVWVPGHTDTCKLNIEADEQADSAAILSARTSQGGDALTSARPMLRNHMRRRARQLLNNSWYHWYMEQKSSPWGPRKAAGHTYLEQSVLWSGKTVNWLDKKEVRRINARTRPRWLAVPEQTIMAPNSFDAARAVIRARLNMPTRNVIDARTAKVAHPQCPWCDNHADSVWHRFECDSLQPNRDALAGKMWEAVAPPTEEVRQEWPWDVMKANFNWDILVKGDYKNGLFYNLERFTAPPKETRKALTGILHSFLEDTRFFARVYGWRADRIKEVETAHDAYIKAKKDASDAAAGDAAAGNAGNATTGDAAAGDAVAGDGATGGAAADDAAAGAGDIAADKEAAHDQRAARS
jgi:hypothetical protein